MGDVTAPTPGRVVFVRDSRNPTQKPWPATVVAVSENDLAADVVVFCGGYSGLGWLENSTPETVLTGVIPHKSQRETSTHPRIGPYYWTWPTES